MTIKKLILTSFSFLLSYCTYSLYATEPFYPNDSLYIAGDLSYLDFINAPKAWAIAKHYGKVKVGIADYYFHEAHPDLTFDTIYGDNEYSTRNYDHGTMVSGFLAAKTNNKTGIASISGFNAKIIAYDLSNENEIVAIRKLAQMGCKVINYCSSGPYHNSQDEHLFDSILHYYDCLVVCSAGNGPEQNNATSPSQKLYPASYPSCLSVTSVGHKNNYGDTLLKNWKDVHCFYVNDSSIVHQHNDAVDICAPGYELRSTNYWHGVAGYSNNRRGTSCATPIVAGVAAMVRAVNPNLSAVEVMNILKSTADTTLYTLPENAEYIGRLGAGRIDAYKAVRTACAVDIENDIISGNDTISGCVVTLKNVALQENTNLRIESVVETELISNVYIPEGSTFEITPVAAQ